MENGNWCSPLSGVLRHTVGNPGLAFFDPESRKNVVIDPPRAESQHPKPDYYRLSCNCGSAAQSAQQASQGDDKDKDKDKNKKKSDGLGGGAIAGIIIGALVLVGAGVVLVYKNQQKNQAPGDRPNSMKFKANPMQPEEMMVRQVSRPFERQVTTVSVQ